MFAFVISTFLVCWLPYHSYFLYSYHNPQVLEYLIVFFYHPIHYWSMNFMRDDLIHDFYDVLSTRKGEVREKKEEKPYKC